MSFSRSETSRWQDNKEFSKFWYEYSNIATTDDIKYQPETLFPEFKKSPLMEADEFLALKLSELPVNQINDKNTARAHIHKSAERHKKYFIALKIVSSLLIIAVIILSILLGLNIIHGGGWIAVDAIVAFFAIGFGVQAAVNLYIWRSYSRAPVMMVG